MSGQTGITGRIVICAIAVLMVLQVQSVGAEELTKEFRKDIEQLMQITGVESLSLQLGVTFSSQVVDAMVSQNPGISPAAVAAIKDEVNVVFAEEVPKLMGTIVPIYAKYFTRDEIRGLIAFYATPLGKKSIDVMPAVMNECLIQGQEWGKNLAPRLAPRLEGRLKREGLKVK